MRRFCVSDTILDWPRRSTKEQKRQQGRAKPELFVQTFAVFVLFRGQSKTNQPLCPILPALYGCARRPSAISMTFRRACCKRCAKPRKSALKTRGTPEKLLARFEIKTPQTSVHQHTSPAKIAALVERLKNGESLALVTDAGTPGVSDPGPVLVQAAALAGITVSPIPGPCALVAALSVSGFDAQKFSFLGFLPRKPGKIRKVFTAASERDETFIFYESPFRVAKTLDFLAEVAPDARVCACREITKHFEETLRGNRRRNRRRTARAQGNQRRVRGRRSGERKGCRRRRKRRG